MTTRQTALVTGASSGLGLEFARLLAEQGHNLVLVARNKARLEAIKDELETSYGITAWVRAQDLTEPDAGLKLFQELTASGLVIDVLINNAGFGYASSFLASDWQRQADMVQLNVVALMQLTHCFLPGMVERGQGKILNISSVAAFSAGPYLGVYYASKSFVSSFSEALAEETKGTGVTVTAFCPGPTKTNFDVASTMGTNPRMFRFAAQPEAVAKSGLKALEAGRVLSYYGGFTKAMALLSRLAPRWLSRKFAAWMNR